MTRRWAQRRTGGHAYGSVYPGPIGAILNPLLNGVESGPVEIAVPYASSLCCRIAGRPTSASA